jgi:hypothetical protein
VTCRSTRASLSADGARGGKPSTFVVLTSGSDDAHAVVVVTEYVSHQSERNGTQHVHRLRLRTEVPAAGDLGALHSLRLTNPALAGSLAVLQTLRSCSATIRATPWLARFLLGTARAAELVALQSVDDRAGDLRYVLGMGVFPTAAVLSDCIGQAQTLARDNVQISLSTADPQRCVSLQVENAAPLEIELSGGGDGAFRPYAAQQEALLSALTRRLTLVIGPPGTGKTDTAVLMIVAMLGRFRGARLLVSAVSNLALDQLIDKLVAFAPTAVLLRLGGQTQLDVARRFTVDGIVAARSRALCALFTSCEQRRVASTLATQFCTTCSSCSRLRRQLWRSRRQWRSDGRAPTRRFRAASGARIRGVSLWRRRRLRTAHWLVHCLITRRRWQKCAPSASCWRCRTCSARWR